MKLLQRYILADLLKVFLLVSTGVTVLLVFLGVFREVSEKGLGPLQALQILPYVIPSLLPFTIPATMLLTVCVVYGRLSGNQEITAAKAAGINVFSLLWPSLFLGGLLSAGSLILTDQAIPWAVQKIEMTVVDAMEDIFLDKLRSELQFVDHRRGLAITVIKVEDRKLIKPTFRYNPQGGKTVTLQADEATLTFDHENQQVILHLVHGFVDIPGQQKIWIDEDDYPLPLPTELRKPVPRNIPIEKIRTELKTVAKNQKQSDERQVMETAFALTMGDFDRFESGEFQRAHWENRAADSRKRKLNAEMHNRYALACSCFFFVLVGSPFSIMKARRQFLTSFFLCFTPIIIIYYPIMMLVLNQAKAGKIDPTWGMWVGNCLMAIAGLYFLRKVMRH